MMQKALALPKRYGKTLISDLIAWCATAVVRSSRPVRRPKGLPVPATDET
jgi:hypothetical protein